MALLEEKDLVSRSYVSDPSRLKAHIRRALQNRCCSDRLFPREQCEGAGSSSVLFLLGFKPAENGHASEVCLILNKRSQEVTQPGDLCCPGGAVETTLDPCLAKLLLLPGTPLTRWPYWSTLRHREPHTARLLSLLVATALRESWEEMRVNPLFTSFLGPLPSQRLLLFKRVIHPMVAWIHGQKRFSPNWEVEKVVYIPLRSLLEPHRYGRYRFCVPRHLEKLFRDETEDFLCFMHVAENEEEMLWGATFKIVLKFLWQVFGFVPPPMDSLPIVPGVLHGRYMRGRD